MYNNFKIVHIIVSIPSGLSAFDEVDISFLDAADRAVGHRQFVVRTRVLPQPV